MTVDELDAALHVAIHVGDTEAIAVLSEQLDAAAQPATIHPLSAALWYAEAGLPVFPLAAGTKLPHKGSRGCLDATLDAKVIRSWWEAAPESNVGIACGHRVDVVDVDGLLGQTSRAHHWTMFEHNLGAVLTPRPGGMHLYVTANPKVGNGASILPGVDYRGLGGYVVAPPSVTDVGTYRWLRPLTLEAAS